MEPVKIPITDTLDLHTFDPGEVKSLLIDYFSECVKNNIYSVRVVHGKGTGALRRRVHAALAKNQWVASFEGASPSAGGWGATIVYLKPNHE